MDKILITGGHVTPALAVIDTLRAEGNSEIIFAGRMHATEGSTALSAEYELVRAKGIWL